MTATCQPHEDCHQLVRCWQVAATCAALSLSARTDRVSTVGSLAQIADHRCGGSLILETRRDWLSRSSFHLAFASRFILLLIGAISFQRTWQVLLKMRCKIFIVCAVENKNISGEIHLRRCAPLRTILCFYDSLCTSLHPCAKFHLRSVQAPWMQNCHPRFAWFLWNTKQLPDEKFWKKMLNCYLWWSWCEQFRNAQGIISTVTNARAAGPCKVCISHIFSVDMLGYLVSSFFSVVRLLLQTYRDSDVLSVLTLPRQYTSYFRPSCLLLFC